jgi:hypothetical protein
MPLWKCVEEKSPRPPCASHPDVGQVKNWAFPSLSGRCIGSMQMAAIGVPANTLH